MILCGSDDPERIFPPCMIALAALASETDVMMFFTMSGVRVVRKGEAEKIRIEGLPKRLTDMLQDLRDMGAKMVACSTCFDIVGMTEDDLMQGVTSAGTAIFVAEALTADAVLTF